MMTLLVLLLLALVNSGNAVNNGLNITDIAGLTSHVLHLEKLVSDIQARSQTQEQKQAAVMSSVLSKFTSTSVAMEKLQREHNSTISELERLKVNYNSTVHELQTFKEILSNLTSLPGVVEKLHLGYNETLASLTSITMDQNSTLHNLTTVKAQLRTATDSLRDVNAKLYSLEITQNSSVATLRHFVQNSKLACPMNNESYQELKEAETKLASEQKVITVAEYNSSRELSVLKTQLQSLESVKLHQSKVLASIDREVDSIKRNLSRTQDVSSANSQGLLDLTAKISGKQDIMFMASQQAGVKNIQNYPKGATLKFNHELYSVGDGYDSKTGWFTAPVAGTYLFWINAVFINNLEATVSIRKGSMIIGQGTGYSSSNGSHGNINAFASVHLTTSSRVRFATDNSLHLIPSKSNCGGVLLHAD